MTLATGSVLRNRYRIEELLGSGGMGAVYRAYDVELHQLVAIKENIVAAPGILPDRFGTMRRQFQQEATMLASLHHPNIPGVVDHFDAPDGNQYLVMDYVEGEDLATIIARQGSLGEAEAIAWVGQVCNALDYLHSRTPPIIHRDIKPQNIKVTSRGQVFLVDFGIAKLGGSDRKTTKGALSVTPGFSPPEQYAMQGTDARSDVYSLGATLYALLTGEVPPDSISLQGGEVQLVPPRHMNAAISPAVQQAVLKAMEPKRIDRPQTVAQFWQMLNSVSGVPEAKTIALADAGTVPGADALGKPNGLAGSAGLVRVVRSFVTTKNNLRLILLGAGAIVVLVAALALSLSKPQAQPAGGDTTLPVVAIQNSPTGTATETFVPPTPEAVATRREIVLSDIEAAPLLPGVLAAATGTADARFIETQQAMDVTATRLAARFLDCDKIELQVLQPLVSVQTVAVAVANVELTWRVRNTSTAFDCQWGEKGQESQVLRAVLVGGLSDSGTPVRLKWVQDDEYDLSLDVQLSPGSYLLSWRLLLPKTKLPDGPTLGARVGVIALTPRPTATPTQTPCPSIDYPCHCRTECVGRVCTTVCDECTIVKCN